ncbi:MAG: hypothetical protein H7X91_00225 [Burkholderiales bacterium]|nr:hypothetical protein [Burkholderiales bacterium]
MKKLTIALAALATLGLAHQATAGSTHPGSILNQPGSQTGAGLLPTHPTHIKLGRAHTNREHPAVLNAGVAQGYDYGSHIYPHPADLQSAKRTK